MVISLFWFCSFDKFTRHELKLIFFGTWTRNFGGARNFNPASGRF